MLSHRIRISRTWSYKKHSELESLPVASDDDIEAKIIDVSKNSPKELLLTSHFVTKVKNNLESDGVSASKNKIRKIIEKLRTEGKIEFPDFNE